MLVIILLGAIVISGVRMGTSQVTARGMKCQENEYGPYSPQSSKSYQISDELNGYVLHSIPSRCQGDRPDWHPPNKEEHKNEALLVAASHNGVDTSWMAEELHIPYLVYMGNDFGALHHHAGIGNEAGAYLQYIVEYYDCLPEVTLFAHSHQGSNWHRNPQKHSLQNDVKAVRWAAVPGFAILHRHGIMVELYSRDPHLTLAGFEKSTDNLTSCSEVAMLNGTAYDPGAVANYLRADWILMSWTEFFGPLGLGPVPNQIRASVGGEMFVTKDRIQSHPREFYLRMIEWMISANSRHQLNSYEIGCVFELIWHIIFGEPALMPLDLTIAECELYRCPRENRGLRF